MPTFAEHIAEHQQRLTEAKIAAALAREDSKEKPADRRLRMRAELKSEETTKCGRDLALIQFWSLVEDEHNRIADGDVVVPPILWASAPRVRGEIDGDWVCAASLQRRGIATAPKGWRSKSGEPLNARFGIESAVSADSAT
jgi:hypothetical protein